MFERRLSSRNNSIPFLLSFEHYTPFNFYFNPGRVRIFLPLTLLREAVQEHARVSSPLLGHRQRSRQALYSIPFLLQQAVPAHELPRPLTLLSLSRSSCPPFIYILSLYSPSSGV